MVQPVPLPLRAALSLRSARCSTKVRQCLLSRQEQSFVSVNLVLCHVQIVQKIIRYSSIKHSISTCNVSDFALQLFLLEFGVSVLLNVLWIEKKLSNLTSWVLGFSLIFVYSKSMGAFIKDFLCRSYNTLLYVVYSMCSVFFYILIFGEFRAIF